MEFIGKHSLLINYFNLLFNICYIKTPDRFPSLSLPPSLSFFFYVFALIKKFNKNVNLDLGIMDLESVVPSRRVKMNNLAEGD